MQTATTPYLAYRLTNQPIYLGLLGFAGALPSFFFTLPAGALIERLNKRKVVIVMQALMMLQAFTMAYLALSGRITIWHMIALSFVMGTANSVEITARQAMMVELTSRESLPNAIALNSTIFNTARILGPSLAAPFLIFLQNTGEGWAFFSNGISYLFVLGSLFMIRPNPRIAPDRSLPFIKGFVDGQKYVRGTGFVFALIAMAALPGFFGFPLIQQIPVFARDVLRAAGDTAATVATRNSLLLTFMGIGTLLSSIGLAARSTSMRNKGRVMLAGQIVFSLSLIGLSFVRITNLAFFFMVLLGWGQVTQLALYNTLIQLTVPDELRARVMSTYLWSMLGVAPFGSLLVGWIVQTFGAPTAAFTAGVVCLGGFLAAHLLNPEVRRTVL
jgi:MFS family permease